MTLLTAHCSLLTAYRSLTAPARPADCEPPSEPASLGKLYCQCGSGRRPRGTISGGNEWCGREVLNQRHSEAPLDSLEILFADPALSIPLQRRHRWDQHAELNSS